MVALAVPMGVGRFAFTPILPMMQVDAGLSIAAGAWVASATVPDTLSGALAATAVRVPIRPAVRGGLATIGLATLAMGLERRVPAWIALRLIAGIATGWVLPFASAWALERLAPLRRPLLNAAVFAGYGVGIAAAGGVCIVLMHGRASSAQAWLSLGLVSLAATAVVWRSFVGRDVRSEASRRTGTGRCDTDAMLLVACYGSFGFGYIVPATFLPVMARGDRRSVRVRMGVARVRRHRRRVHVRRGRTVEVARQPPPVEPGARRDGGGPRPSGDPAGDRVDRLRRARRRRGCPRAQPPVTDCMIVITSPDFTGRSRLASQRVLSSLWKHST